MMSVHINAERKEFANGCTVAQALAVLGYQREKIAVAINGEFVPRSQYIERTLSDGDAVDVVAPVQGG